MAEEMVIHIQEDGTVIGPIPISLANSDPRYLHLEVAVVVVDQSKRVIFQKRSETKKVAPGVWTIAAAGHVSYGDSSEQTAHKELLEEMGIRVKKLYPIFTSKESLINETHLIDWYLGFYHGGDIVVQESEVETYAWVSQEEMPNFISANTVSSGSQTVAHRYWSGEWDHLLK